MVEVGGIEPPSENSAELPSTCVAFPLFSRYPLPEDGPRIPPAFYFRPPLKASGSRVPFVDAAAPPRGRRTECDGLTLVRQPWRN